MDINVNGTGKKYYKPDQITLNFDFNCKNADYEAALSNGVERVTNYLAFLNKLGFKKEEIKTLSFRVTESRFYNELTKKYEKDGFLFQQNVKLKFDYDMEKLSKLMEETSKIQNPPLYYISFNLKDNKTAEQDLIGLAYKEAEFQAQAVANAAGKKLKECAKISFEPFTSALVSPTSFERDMCFKKSEKFGVSTSEQIQQTFVPEDILVTKTVYCLFIAD